MNIDELIEKFREKECVLFQDNRSRIVLNDKKSKSKFKANNSDRKEICVLKVDDYIKTEACDFIVFIFSKENTSKLEKVFIIELKGENIKKATKQIETTLNFLLNEIDFISLKNVSIYARSVHSHVPKSYKSYETRLTRELARVNKNFLNKEKFEILLSRKEKFYDNYKSCNKWENF